MCLCVCVYAVTSKSTSASQQKERGKNTENMCEMKILFGLGLLEDGCNETFSKILHVGVAELFAEKMHFFFRPHCRLTYSISFKSKNLHLHVSLFPYTIITSHFDTVDQREKEICSDFNFRFM